MKSGEIIKFRIYPESVHGFYFDVEIHPTVEGMRQAAGKAGGSRTDFRNAQAGVSAFRLERNDRHGRVVRLKILGLITFHYDTLGTEIISHECTHAALRWMEAMKFNALDRSGDYTSGEASDNEERFCYALGRMAAQIANKCWDNNLYE